MKYTFYFLTLFVTVSIVIAVYAEDAQYAVIGITLAAIIGAVSGLLRAPKTEL